jgi:hypothetical protein
MPDVRGVLKPSVWVFYAVFVLEILFLFTRARTHFPHAAGREIVLRAHGRDPIVVARVDISGPAVTAVETPPAHVRWGDIPTPMF